ncbi:hypothetical protein HNQ10_000749 [Deinococcus metallilatus]|uniref:Uncharacterized protein n=1 Tax=Deinococcus metallilatus TaxID=1211322 RepID=A0ABR6MRL3_9DEIO|nr:hypothetical protein [Deinococcus metallilatus]
MISVSPTPGRLNALRVEGPGHTRPQPCVSARPTTLLPVPWPRPHWTPAHLPPPSLRVRTTAAADAARVGGRGA